MNITKYKLTIGAVAVLSLILAVGGFGQTPQQADGRELVPNQTIEREMTGAETHRYKFDLQKDEFFQVRVEQKGVDVALRLVDANGNELARMDSPNSKEGSETLSFIAVKAGGFVLEVGGFDAKAAKGVYLIKRETSRTATATDKRRVEIERLFVEGMTARDAAGQAETAIKKLESATAGWRELKDEYLAELTEGQIKQLKLDKAKAVYVEADALFDQHTAESFQTAREKFRVAADLFAAAGNKQQQAISFAFVGRISDDLGEKSAALKSYNQALLLFRSLADKEWEAAMLNKIGAVYYGLGEIQQALKFYNESLPLRRAIGNKRGEAITLTDIGAVYSALGDKQQALKFYNDALPLRRAVGDKSGEATTLNNIGLVYSDLGDKQQALKFYNESLLLFREVGDKSGEATTLTNIGRVYDALGNKQQALKFYNESLPLFRAVGDKSGEAATLMGIGAVYSALGDKQQALKFYNESLPLFRVVGDKRGEAATLTGIGTVYDDLGEKQQALKFYNESLLLFRVVGDKSGEAVTLNNIGGVYDDLGEKQQALKFYNDALPLRRAVGDKSGEAVTLNNVMIVWYTLGNRRLAAFYGKQSVNKYQELRQAIQELDKETQKTYLKTVEDTYRGLADILIADGRFAQAEQILRMLKDEEYFEFVRRDADEIKNLNSRVALSQAEKDLIARYELLADRVAEIGLKLQKLQERKSLLSRTDAELSADEQKQFDEYSIQIADANAAFKLFLDKELVAEFKQENITQIEVDRSLQDKLKNWGAGVVSLSTVVGEDRYRVILTTPTVQIDGKTEIKSADLNKKIFAFRAALQNPQIDPRPLGKEIYDVLIKPIEKQLEQAGAKTLIWSLDGTLRYVPLAALSPDGKSYLIEKYQSVVVTPKIRDGLSDSTVSADWRALGLGVSAAQTVADPDNPNAKISFNQLPGTRAELAAIVSDDENKTGVLTGKRFLDETFTTKNLIDSLAKETVDGKRRYTIIHIASHFRLGSNRANSFLLLGGNQILSLEEISKSANISFGGVDLITLSACNTAFADESNGREVDSLAEVIQTKSGKAVLATLWAVADESTQLLMSEFYRIRTENPKLTKAEAIQIAQQSMISGKLKSSGKTAGCRSEVVKLDGTAQTEFKCDKNAPFSHPYFWSPFVLIGNWR